MKKPNQKKQRLVQLSLVGLCLLNIAVYYVLVRPIIQADQIATNRALEIQNKLTKRRLVHNKIAQIEGKGGTEKMSNRKVNAGKHPKIQ